MAIFRAQVRKALGDEHHFGATVGGLAHEPMHGDHVGVDIGGGGHLHDARHHSLRVAQCVNLRIDTFINKPRPSMVESKLDPP